MISLKRLPSAMIQVQSPKSRLSGADFGPTGHVRASVIPASLYYNSAVVEHAPPTSPVIGRQLRILETFFPIVVIKGSSYRLGRTDDLMDLATEDELHPIQVFSREWRRDSHGHTAPLAFQRKQAVFPRKRLWYESEDFSRATQFSLVVGHQASPVSRPFDAVRAYQVASFDSS